MPGNSVQVWPSLSVQGEPPGPVATVASQALLSPWVAAQVPLAANAPSPGCAAGGFLSSGQPSLPPLLVCRKGKWASYESSIRMARRGVQNAKQSQKSRGSVAWACNLQVLPPSSVL